MITITNQKVSILCNNEQEWETVLAHLNPYEFKDPGIVYDEVYPTVITNWNNETTLTKRLVRASSTYPGAISYDEFIKNYTNQDLDVVRKIIWKD